MYSFNWAEPTVLISCSVVHDHSKMVGFGKSNFKNPRNHIQIEAAILCTQCSWEQIFVHCTLINDLHIVAKLFGYFEKSSISKNL